MPLKLGTSGSARSATWTTAISGMEAARRSWGELIRRTSSSRRSVAEWLSDVVERPALTVVYQRITPPVERGVDWRRSDSMWWRMAAWLRRRWDWRERRAWPAE